MLLQNKYKYIAELVGDFFSNRLAECDELQCGDTRQNCCVERTGAFCCNPLDDNDGNNGAPLNNDNEGLFACCYVYICMI